MLWPLPEYVDFSKGPPTPLEPNVLHENETRIQVSALFVNLPSNADQFPLRLDGNLKPISGGPGMIAQKHWAIETSRALIDYWFEGEDCEPDSVVDKLPVFNPSPIVELNLPEIGESGAENNPSMVVTGSIICFLAPIEKDHVMINGKEAATVTLVDSGPDGRGPFTMEFTSDQIRIGNDDFAIVVAAVNALDNIGYDGVTIKPEWMDDGFLFNRVITEQDSVPTKPADLEAYLDKYRFKLILLDPVGLEGETAVNVKFNTGIEEKTVTLDDIDSSCGTIKSAKYYYLTPKNLKLPASTPQVVKDTRLKSNFGLFPKITYPATGNSIAEDTGVPHGILLVRSGNPISVVQSGVQKDVKDGSADITLIIEAGVFGGVGKTIVSTVTSHDELMVPLAAPSPAAHYAPRTVTGDPVKLTRLSDDPENPAYNHYRSNNQKPLMGVRTQMPLSKLGVQEDNANITELFVNYRGYAKVVSSAITGAENVEPVFGLQTIVAKPTDINGITDAHPQMVEGDLVRLFNFGPIVHIKNQNTSLAGTASGFDIEGEVVSFVKPLSKADVTINGVEVQTLTQDNNNPTHGPYRATFSHAMFPIDRQMKRQTVIVVAVDEMRNIGYDSVLFEAVNGGLDALGAPDPVTSRNLVNQPSVPSHPAIVAMTSDNTVTLKEALVFMRNRQCRFEGNPILRGKLTTDNLTRPFMADVTEFATARLTDAAGATTTTGGGNINLTIDMITAPDLIQGGGGFASGRQILLPQRPTGISNRHGQVVANPGEFKQLKLAGTTPIRPEVATPMGGLIMESDELAADVVIPGHQKDVGAAAGAIADITLRIRMGAWGYDESSGAGRPELPAELNSLDYKASDVNSPPSVQPFTRNDLRLPAGFAPTRAEWVNYPLSKVSDVTAPPAGSPKFELHRVSDDPADPRFHLFRFKKTTSVDEQLITPVSTGTYSVAATETSESLSLKTHRGLHYVQNGGWLKLSSSKVTDGDTFEPVFGAYAIPDHFVTSILSDKTGSGSELADNFMPDHDFSVQMGERPIAELIVVAGHNTAAGANNLLYRVERKYVDDKGVAASDDKVSVGRTGDQTVAYLDVRADAAGHQSRATVTRPGTYRFPPAGADADYRNLINIGVATSPDEFPLVPASALASINQTTFEGVNLPNQGIPMAAKALPPGVYYLRPVMESPVAGRYVLGNSIRVSVPQLYRLDFTAKGGAFTNELNSDFAIAAGANAAAMQTALERQIVRLMRDDYRIGTPNTTENPAYDVTSVNVRFLTAKPAGGATVPLINEFTRVIDMGGKVGTGFGAARPVPLNGDPMLNAMTGANVGVFSKGFLDLYPEFNAMFLQFSGTRGRAVANVYKNGANYWIESAPVNGTYAMGEVVLAGAPAVGTVGAVVPNASREGFGLPAPFIQNGPDYWEDVAVGGTVGTYDAGDTVIIDADASLVAKSPYGSVVGDTVVNITSVMEGKIGQSIIPWPGAPTRLQRAVNAYVGHARLIGGTASHEVGHSLGLVSPAAHYVPFWGTYGHPVARRANLAVGEIGVHNGQRAGDAPGVHPLFGGAGVVDAVDDLGAPFPLVQNYLMDRGDMRDVGERLEVVSSNVSVDPEPAPALEDQGAWSPRNLLYLRAILPYED